MVESRIWLSRGLRVTGTVLAAAWIATQLELAPLLSTFRALPFWAYFVPTTAILLNTVLQALRLRLVFGGLGHTIGIAPILSALFRGSFVGLALPSGGNELAKMAFLGRGSPGFGMAATAMIAIRILQLPVWIGLLVWGIGSGYLERTPALLTAAYGFVVLASGVLLVAGGGGSLIPGWLKLGARISRFREDSRVLRSNTGVLIWTVVLGGMTAFINCGIVWALLAAVSQPLSLGAVLALVPAADVLIWLPISIGGVGVRESVCAIAFTPWGLALPEAVAIGLTRWTGELARGAIGCMLMLLGTASRDLRPHGESKEGAENE